MERSRTEVEAVIEVPRGSRNKHELDSSTNSMRLDRVLFCSVHYSTGYGFIPKTRWPDGDPLDVVVIVEEPTFPACLLNCLQKGVKFCSMTNCL